MMTPEEQERQRLWQMSVFERELQEWGYGLIAGIDEAGRGPLAGPVVAAAVILPPNCLIPGIDDSKKLSETKRVKLEILIKEQAVAYAIAMVNQRVIDRINILEASRLAMVRAVQKLPTQPQYLLIDALKLPLEMRQTSLIHGDARSISIAAASILAKNYRDRLMVALDQRFPGYGWRNNKGYPTQAHRQAIMELGFSCIHRKTFKVKP